MRFAGGNEQSHESTDDRWLSDSDYEFFCRKVPVVCVDVLPVLSGSTQFGLIERDTPSGRGLNLVGGGVLIDESIHEALLRHVRTSLGDEAHLDLGSLTFVGVYQYFKVPRPGELHDPRKNAVSVTFAGTIAGRLCPANEAHEFHVFELGHPPALGEFGFGQGPVVLDALAAVKAGEQRPYRGGLPG